MEKKKKKKNTTGKVDRQVTPQVERILTERVLQPNSIKYQNLPVDSSVPMFLAAGTNTA